MTLCIVGPGRLSAHILVACAGSLALSGCFDHPEAESSTEAWPTLVERIDSGHWSPADRWTASVTLRLGAEVDEGPELFGRIGSLAAGSRGTIYVLDVLAQEVRVFHPDGMFSHEFGRSGEGPGEFGYADGIAVGPEGNVWVYDPARTQVSVFDPDGRYLHALPRPSGGAILPWPGRILPDGSLVDWLFSFPERGGVGRRVIGSLNRYQPIVVSPDGSIDTFPPIEGSFPAVDGFRIPFGASFSFAQDLDGTVWFSGGAEYRLLKRTLEGDTLLEVRLEGFEPAEIPDRYADSVWAARTDPRRIARGDIPTHRPAIERLLLDGGGHLLVFPRAQGHAAGEVIDVFDSSRGAYLGRVLLPESIEPGLPASAHPGWIHAVTRTGLDEHRVVRIELSDGYDQDPPRRPARRSGG